MIDADLPASAIERELGLLVRRAQSHGRELARRVHPELDLAAYLVMVRLDACGGERVSDLAAYFGVDKSVTSRQVAALEGLGMVSRTPDPADARAQQLRLTADGAARLRRVRTARRRQFQQLLVAWPAEDVSRFAGYLSRFNALY